ncbi:MAG: EAL domain-containing protein [Solirubrobacteraceae bacterium]
MWPLLAIAITFACAAGTVFGARLLKSSSDAKTHAAFRQSSIEVASTVQLAIQREQDLVVTAEGFFLDDPDASTAGFHAWSTSLQALQRFPELVTWGEIRLVPAAKLTAFATKFFGAPAGAGAFTPIPPGARPYYCLAAAVQDRASQPAVPAGVDYCAASSLITSRDTGKGTYTAVNLGEGTIMAVNEPFYRGGVVPATVAERRAAFAGWIGVSFDPRVPLAAALRGHPGTAVALRFHAPRSSETYAASSAVFRVGKRPADARSVTVDLNDGWTLQTFAAAAPDGVFADTSVVILLIGGMLLSLLIGALVLVLGTGRFRALALVDERTRELRYQALHDPLTGLPNRTLIMDRIGQLLARARRSGSDGAALYVDLDEFKNVNDTLGHAAGDRLLVAAATRLKSTLRESDTIGRMGGDEFVVLIDGGALSGPDIVAERMLAAMRLPFDLGDGTNPVIVTTSVGIATGDRESAGELLRDADVALYQAKAAGKNRQYSFSADVEAASSHRSELELDLRSALEANQFRLLYQPIYKLDDLSVVGVEALLRWAHPTLGLVQPGIFIPILERTGQIREVGHWVLREACAQMAAWHAQGDTIDISINVSGAQLDSDEICEHVKDALAYSGLDAGAVILEVTETSLMRNASETARRLRAIKKLGVRIAVDDFGTGYSSLAYLQQFPVDSLKIDRMFTNAITAWPDSKALIATVAQLAHDLGLTTLAEGVETPAQLDHLRREQIDEIQGFLLSRPLDAHTLEEQILAPGRPTADRRPIPKAGPRSA